MRFVVGGFCLLVAMLLVWKASTQPWGTTAAFQFFGAVVVFRAGLEAAKEK